MDHMLSNLVWKSKDGLIIKQVALIEIQIYEDSESSEQINGIIVNLASVEVNKFVNKNFQNHIYVILILIQQNSSSIKLHHITVIPKSVNVENSKENSDKNSLSRNRYFNVINWYTMWKDDYKLNKNFIEFNWKSLISLMKKLNCFGINEVIGIENSYDFLTLLNNPIDTYNMQSIHILLNNSVISSKSHISSKNQSNHDRKPYYYPPRESEKFYVGERSPMRNLLGPVHSEDRFKKCCVIDLDETLVHSSFKELIKYDFKIHVEIEGMTHEIFILKRPYVDLFLNKMSSLFECVLFTASLGKYANPVTDLLDKDDVFRYRLFRESCVFMKGGFVKDLSTLGRALDQIVIIDNSPVSFMLHPQNAIHITTWFDDLKDRALLDLIPYLQNLSQASSVINYLKSEQPPLSAAWPASLNPKSTSRTFYSNLYLPNIPNQTFKNNPVVNLTQPDQTALKKSTTSSTISLKKTMFHTLPTLRNLFTKTFTGNSTEKNGVSHTETSPLMSKYFLTSRLRPSKDFPLNLERNLTQSSHPDKSAFETPSSSTMTYNTTIKQNLNSASVIFSPRYSHVKYNKSMLSTIKPSNRIRYFLKRHSKKLKQ